MSTGNWKLPSQGCAQCYDRNMGRVWEDRDGLSVVEKNLLGRWLILDVSKRSVLLQVICWVGMKERHPSDKGAHDVGTTTAFTWAPLCHQEGYLASSTEPGS
jgi:hypothetical protein